MQSPETRFSFRDRSKELRLTLSPRLKSFPAEKIKKKWDNTSMFVPEPISALVTQQDPYKSGTFYSNYLVRNNNGYDDAIITQVQHSKSASGTNQQCVTGKQIYQSNPHADSLISKQQIASLEEHSHRAFVPNISHHGVTISDRSLQNSPTIFNQPKVVQATNPQQSSCNLHTVIDQNCPELSTLSNECEKQPIGDRNVVNHKHIMQIQQQKQTAIIKDPNASCNNKRSTHHCQNIYYIPPHDLLEQIYQQSHQMSNKMQLMPNQQQQIYNNNNNLEKKCYYYNQQLIDSPTQGMTSPQDMTIIQMKLMQCNPSFNQSVWPQKNQWIGTTTQSQQHLHQSLSQHHMPTINFNQHNFKFQGQSNLSKNHMKHKSTHLIAKDNQNSGNQLLYFTPDMIRDQELLVSTLRQQHVSDEVLRRQFDALLNEQRRHLSYAAQFQQEADILDTKQIRCMRKRTEDDEKPEWMVHVTPPRISYNEMEKIKAQQNSEIQCSLNNQLLEKRNTTMAIHQQNYYQQKNEEVAKQIVSSHQEYLQNNPDQHIVNWSCRNLPSNHAAFEPYGFPQKIRDNLYYQSNPTFKGYIYHPCNIYSDHSYHSEKIWHKPSNSNTSNLINSAYLCKRAKNSTEPSSLLKMKVYKEIICPQKRNNGLQDSDTIQNARETLKDPANKKGLEYLAMLPQKKSIMRLNGVQNPYEIPEDMQPRFPTKTNIQPSKEISSNGLENSRNSDNFPLRILQSKRQNEPIMTEYPQQTQRAKGNFYYVHGGKDNNNVTISQRHKDTGFHTQDAQSFYNRRNIPLIEKYHNNNTTIFYDFPQHYQIQQYYPNEQNGYNGQGDIARKQQPNALNATRICHASGDISKE